MNEKWGWAAASVAAAAVLAYIIVDRLDNQALAVLTGAVCGALAGVPVAALMFWIVNRERNAQRVRQQVWRERPPPPPQVIVVQSPPAAVAPAAPPGYAPWHSSGAIMPPARPPRKFHIVGDEEEEDGDP
jgi:hypothetical protein